MKLDARRLDGLAIRLLLGADPCDAAREAAGAEAFDDGEAGIDVPSRASLR
jgi:hypothetical protein